MTKNGFTMLAMGLQAIRSLKCLEEFNRLNFQPIFYRDSYGREQPAFRNLECSEEFSQRNFAPSDYTDDRGKKQPAFNMTKNGFVMLAMGFTSNQEPEMFRGIRTPQL
jgi:phage regulator Rha-like protein